MIIEERFMTAALAQARLAAKLEEVPVGAVIIKDNEIIAADHNRCETNKDSTAHAEILVIQKASALLGGWRLTGCSLYVTLEPCAMCAGAMVQSRLEKLSFGAYDPKAGAAGSLFNIVEDARLNHQLEVFGGILEVECADLLKQFFAGRRR